jgi:hypothetical protein
MVSSPGERLAPECWIGCGGRRCMKDLVGLGPESGPWSVSGGALYIEMIDSGEIGTYLEWVQRQACVMGESAVRSQAV